MYYIDIETFITKIVIPAVLPFCRNKCKGSTAPHPLGCNAMVKDKKDILRCFLSVDVKELRHQINLVLIRPNNDLLSAACDKNIEDVFAGITDDAAADYGDYFESIVELCEGSIDKLTVEAIEAYQKGCEAANSRRKKVGETLEDTYDYEATQVYLDNKANKTNRFEGETFENAESAYCEIPFLIGETYKNTVVVGSVKRKEFFFREKIR